MYWGFEKPGITGGEGSPLLPPSLLGGVLKGDTSAASDALSGARLERVAISPGRDLLGILGFPARFTGGGIGGAEATGRSILRGSALGNEPVWDGNRGFALVAGRPSRVGVFHDLAPFEAPPTGLGECSAAWDVGREGRGEWILRSGDFEGDPGEWTVTLGGDLALVGERGFGDLGGEKAIMEMGRGLGLLHGVRTVVVRGVTDAAPL